LEFNQLHCRTAGATMNNSQLATQIESGTNHSIYIPISTISQSTTEAHQENPERESGNH
jgi:hypothetical protein